MHGREPGVSAFRLSRGVFPGQLRVHLPGVVDPRSLFVIDRTFSLPGGAQDQRAGRDLGAGKDDGSRTNQRATANDRIVHDDGAHSDEAVVFDPAAVNDGAVPDGDPLSHAGYRESAGAMNDSAILKIAVCVQFNPSLVSTQYGSRPDGDPRAQFDVSEHLCACMNPGRRVNGRA